MTKQFTFPFNFEMLNDERFKDVYIKEDEVEFLVTDISLNKELGIFSFSYVKNGIKEDFAWNIPEIEMCNIEQRTLHFTQGYLYHKTETQHNSIWHGDSYKNSYVTSHYLHIEKLAKESINKINSLLTDFLDGIK